MMRKIFILLGNGFTLDFIDSVNKSDIIDVKNLFKNGEKVPWPGNNHSGFLSYKYCPNLWNLGARHNLNSSASELKPKRFIFCSPSKVNSKSESPILKIDLLIKSTIYLLER